MENAFQTIIEDVCRPDSVIKNRGTYDDDLLRLDVLTVPLIYEGT